MSNPSVAKLAATLAESFLSPRSIERSDFLPERSQISFVIFLRSSGFKVLSQFFTARLKRLKKVSPRWTFSMIGFSNDPRFLMNSLKFFSK